MIKFSQNILNIVMILLLTGCSSYKSSFECRANGGVGCKSVSKVYGMIDKGELPANVEISQNKKVKKQVIKAKNKLPFPQIIPANLHAVDVLRKPESVLRIWLAPYVSKDGAYQEAQYIYEVVDPGVWIEENRA